MIDNGVVGSLTKNKTSSDGSSEANPQCCSFIIIIVHRQTDRLTQSDILTTLPGFTHIIMDH